MKSNRKSLRQRGKSTSLGGSEHGRSRELKTKKPSIFRELFLATGATGLEATLGTGVWFGHHMPIIIESLSTFSKSSLWGKYDVLFSLNYLLNFSSQNL